MVCTNENLEAMSFADGAFDVVVALDVLEHVPAPARAVAEISRVLAPDGVAVLTFPIRAGLTAATTPRALFRADGTIEHLAEPEWHGDPFDEAGALVFTDFGYDVHQWLSECSGRPVRVLRFADEGHGVAGELTDVCVIGSRLTR